MESSRGTLRVTHVITGLRPHGAELALLRLVRATAGEIDHTVVVLAASAELRPDFEAAGATVHVAGLRPRPDPRPWWRIVSAVRRSRPDVVQTWLPVADLIGGLVGRLATRAPVVWNVRNSEHDPRRWGRPTRLAIAANRRLSTRLPARIVAVGSVAAALHAELGYDASKIVVIHNGFEPARVTVDGPSARRGFGIGDDAVVVCRLCRFHPDKDVPTLLDAWSRVVVDAPDAVLALAGHGLDPSNQQLTTMLREHGVTHSVVPLGQLPDPSVLYAASDLTVSSSLAEGLPNVIGEAMAHGIPAVVTDAGDSALLVGDTGRVVPCADPGALATALHELVTMDGAARAGLGRLARNRIDEEFSMAVMTERYVALWREVADVRN